MNDKEESKMEAKRKDKELYEKVMQDNAKANAAEEEKNSKFIEKVKSVSKFVKDQIETKTSTKPQSMNNNEEKINKDIIGKLETKGML
jgi:DNA-directed RNA polymerase specialized sigma54-like protein